MPSVSRCLPILGVLASAACQPTAQEIAADAIASLFSAESAEWVDMSYAYDESTILWPTAEPFKLSVVAAGITENGYYYAAMVLELIPDADRAVASEQKYPEFWYQVSWGNGYLRAMRRK